MSKNITIFFLSFLLLTLTSCKDEHDGTDSQGEAEQTILLYFPWSGSDTTTGLYGLITDNLNDIKTVIVNKKGLGNSRVMCVMSDSKSSAVMYEIRYRKGICICDTIKRFNNPDLTHSEGISTILNAVINAAPAKEYGMIVGCHGSGWLPAEDSDFAKTRSYGGVGVKYSANIDQLSEAIKETGQKLQFLLFDDCYMANVEVAYEMKDATNWLIASTSEVIDKGIPYAQVFECLLNNPDYESLVNGFYDYYSTYYYPYGALSAINCGAVENMADVMRKINKDWTADSSVIYQIQTLDGYSPSVFFDMGDYVRHLCADPVLLEEFEGALKELVPYFKTTKYIYSELSHSAFKVNTFSGITISDPSINMIAAGKTDTKWWKSTR